MGRAPKRYKAGKNVAQLRKATRKRGSGLLCRYSRLHLLAYIEPEVHKRPLRFYEIDLIRFLAAFAVLLYHFTFRGEAAHNLMPQKFPGLNEVTRYGYLGVEIFFMVSGYVVLMSAYNKTLKQFFLSRVTRLYPAYWVACTITFLAIRLFAAKAGTPGYAYLQDASLTQYAANMTMFHSFFQVRDMDTAYWSLAYELTFYGLIALLIGFKLMKRLDMFLLLWLLYTALSEPMSQRIDGLLLMVRYSPYFVSGMLFFLAQNKLMPNWKVYPLLAFSYLLALRCAQAQVAGLIEAFHHPYSFSIVAAAITAFHVLFFLIIFRKLNLERFGWLSVAGALTYPLYLLHGNIGWIIFERFQQVDKYVLLVGITVLMLGAAYLLHTQVEKRFSKLLGKYVTRVLNIYSKLA